MISMYRSCDYVDLVPIEYSNGKVDDSRRIISDPHRPFKNLESKRT